MMLPGGPYYLVHNLVIPAELDYRNEADEHLVEQLVELSLKEANSVISKVIDNVTKNPRSS